MEMMNETQVMKHLRKMLINTMIMRKMMETLAGHFQEGSSDTEWEDGRQSVSVTATNQHHLSEYVVLPTPL